MTVGATLALRRGMNTFGDGFVSLMDNKRFRAIGIALAAILFSVSMGLLMASKSPSKPIVVGKVLPDVPANIPIMRYMPYPDWRVLELRAALPMAKIGSPSAAGRNGKTLLTRR